MLQQQKKSSRPESQPGESNHSPNKKKKLERAQQEAADARKKGGYQ